MMESRGKIIIALSNIEVNKKIKSLLIEEGYDILASCTSGNELIRTVMQYSPDLVLIGYKLKDMSILEVYDKLYDYTSFLAIVNDSHKSFIEESTDIYCIGTKISNVLLRNSIDIIFQGKKRILKLQQQVQNLEDTLEKRKIVEKAKGKIMNDKSVLENEAFRYIQKLSMDSGKKMSEVATVILDNKL